LRAARRLEAEDNRKDDQMKRYAISAHRQDTRSKPTPCVDAQRAAGRRRGIGHATTLLRPALLAAALAAICALPAAATAPAAGASSVQKLQLRHTHIGTILVDSSGFTLYRFSKDTGARNTCIASRECAATWPALTSSGRPTAGPGVRSSLISTISLPGGKRQVTYAGHPLYLYEPSSERAETSYVGVRQFGGTWYGVSASGANVK
jgi:predicted lipoprotein with Yx(FWY)xxD motif